MKAVIQRVTTAKVTVNDELISSIGKGLCVLIGISVNDTDKDLDYIARKILNIRLFEENGKRWMKSVKDIEGKEFLKIRANLKISKFQEKFCALVNSLCTTNSRATSQTFTVQWEETKPKFYIQICLRSWEMTTKPIA